jgi:hypothetical protein
MVSVWSHSPQSGDVRSIGRRRSPRLNGPHWTPLNGLAQTWKAGWVHALACPDCLSHLRNDRPTYPLDYRNCELDDTSGLFHIRIPMVWTLADLDTSQAAELHFAPEAPADDDAKHRWIKTIPGKGWFVYFRIYGPDEPAFDGSWQLPDFEAIT